MEAFDATSLGGLEGVVLDVGWIGRRGQAAELDPGAELERPTGVGEQLTRQEVLAGEDRADVAADRRVDTGDADPIGADPGQVVDDDLAQRWTAFSSGQCSAR